MRWLEINSSAPLKGKIKIQGSKNSSLALMAASCLADEPVILGNIPHITDIDVVCDILRDIGASIKTGNNNYIINPEAISSSTIDEKHSAAIRTAYYFIGSLLHKMKKVTIGYPGGDNFVSRPIDQHIKGLEALGAKVSYHQKHYTVEAENLQGAEIFFDTISCGATINVMLAAVLAKGKTSLNNAAKDPEIVDTAIMLNKMGAKIYGAGTDKIRIIGVERLGGCEHSAVPDRLIAGSYLIAAGITGGEICVDDVIPEHLTPCMDKLKEIGMSFEVADNYIIAKPAKRIKSARIRTGKYPMFESDFQQPVTVLLLKALGRSIISDKIYPKRFKHCEQLNRMGADIRIGNGLAKIYSHRKLSGTWVHAGDIRAGTSLVLAGLMAEGTTYLTGVEHLERGYEDIIRDFTKLGANIKLCSDDAAMPEDTKAEKFYSFSP